MPHRLLVALALTSALALGACSGDPQPKVAPSPSPSASSASTSPSPSAATQEPEAVVRAWVEARNAALLDGDASSVRALSTSACSTCDESISPIEDVYGKGGHFETDGWRIESAKEASRKGAQAQVDAAIVYAAGRTFPSADAEPVAYEKENHIVVFRLRQQAGTWLVDFIGYLS